ncbi:MAG TPA: hypothetical protein VD866_09270 [Urbifossiella sp.]|nr:hypothetical protein [Urbifossiella sp.]
MSDDERERAARLIQVCDERRAKWELWFPNPESVVEVSRADLLALVEVARQRERFALAAAERIASQSEKLSRKSERT